MIRFTHLRFDGIGTDAARFADLTIPLDDPVTGDPSDSVIWIRNGGGKTSVLSLLFSLFLPAQRHFVWTQTEGRTLGDYVLSGDTSLVSARIATPSGPVVCGAFYEWPDRRRPQDWSRHLSELKRTWFVFRAHPGTFDLEHIRRVDDEDRPLRYRDLVAGLEEISRGTPALRLMICKTQNEWSQALAAHGIDTGLLEAQLRVAGTEGGFEQLFAVSTATEFVDRLIDLLLDDSAAGSLSERIEQFADTLRKIPAYELERDFASELADRLAVVADAAQALAEHHAATVARLAAADELAAGLVAASEVALTAAGEADADAADALQRRGEVYQRRNVAQNRMHAFGLREAVLRRDHALAEVAELTELLAELRGSVAAWEAVEQVVAVRSATERVAELRRQQEELEAGAGPQRQALARAAGLYRYRLRALHAAAEASRLDAGEAAEAAVAEAKSERAAERQHRAAAGEAAAQLRTATERSAQHTVAIAVARDRGDINPGESCQDAHSRWVAAAESARDTQRAASERAAREREAVGIADSDEAAANASAGELAPRHARAEDRWTSLSADHDELCTRDMVREVTGTDTPDLWAARTVLADHLAAEADRLEVAAGDTGAEIARVTRSIVALSDHGLLPARADVTDVIAHLGRAGVVASPGYAYLSRSVPRHRWREVISAHPDIVAGVVVDPDDFDAAAAAVDGLDVPDVVVVADKALLDTAENTTRRRVVTGPLAAAYDPNAAPALRKELTTRRDELAGHRSELRAAHGRVRTLTESLEAFWSAAPTAAEYSAARDVAAELAEKLQAAQVAAQVARGRRQEHLAAAHSATEAAEVAASAAADADAAAARVQPLISAETALPELHHQAETHRHTAAAQNQLAAAAAARAEAAETSRVEAVAAAASATAERDSIATELGELGDVAEVAEHSDADTSTLRARWRAATEDLHRAVTNTALAAKIDEAEGVRASEQRRLDDRDVAAVTAAEQLLAGELDATDAKRRRGRIDTLRAKLDEATRSHQEAGSRAKHWSGEARERPRPPGEHPDAEELTDPDTAHDRFTTEQGRFEQLRSEANRLDDELELSQGVADEQRDIAERLGAAAAQLVAVNADAARAGETPSWAGRPFEAAKVAADATRALVDARELEARWRQHLSTAVQAVRDTATQDRFTSLPRAVRGPAAELDVAALSNSDEATRVREQWRLRAVEFEGEIERADQHRRVCVGDLMGEVAAMCGRLSRAAKVSQLPSDLGDWKDQSFLRINFTDPGGDPDLFRHRVGEAVDAVVARTGGVDGAKLLKMAVRAAVPDGFRVTILKPSPDLHATRVSVTELGQWSGGERLTAAVLLFCVIAGIRADRDGSTDASPGALIIDNPLGKASYRPFVSLQRRIAARMGVQLLYTTGIKDMPAVGSFPNLVRCRNSRAGRFRYLRVEDRDAAIPDDTRLVSAARVHRDGPAPDLAAPPGAHDELDTDPLRFDGEQGVAHAAAVNGAAPTDGDLSEKPQR